MEEQHGNITQDDVQMIEEVNNGSELDKSRESQMDTSGNSVNLSRDEESQDGAGSKKKPPVKKSRKGEKKAPPVKFAHKLCEDFIMAREAVRAIFCEDEEEVVDYQKPTAAGSIRTWIKFRL